MYYKSLITHLKLIKMERFSPAQLMTEKYGTPVENTKSKNVAKRVRKGKAKSTGKYIVKYDADGVKHMILR